MPQWMDACSMTSDDNTLSDYDSLTNNPLQLLDDRPIVVGYAFGPKKMSTMGVVMAEASKTKIHSASILNHTGGTKSSVGNDIQAVSQEGEDEDCNDEEEDDDNKAIIVSRTSLEDEEEPKLLNNSSLRLHALHHPSYSGSSSSSSSNNTNTNNNNNNNNNNNKQQQDNSSGKVVFSMDGYHTTEGLANIVRHFRSSCSDSESTGTCTASTNTDSRMTASASLVTTTRNSVTTTASSYRPTNPTSSSRMVRVSFVPLDLDQPLEEQHGGKLDIILHKLTEDILCMSQLSFQQQQQQHHSAAATETSLSASDQAAIHRVQRLSNFQKEHPNCCLVDDPDRVRTLMSRSDIASTLQECLQNVTTTSGMPVSSPKYAVVGQVGCGKNTTANVEEISQQLSGLAFPMIVKPLVAAGTKASHSMAILMDPSGVDQLVAKAPCLCQEFANHDTLLYKVYVLGDFVSVHKRRSLPNLPSDCKSRLSFVAFDSQRPYPRLSDFGYDDDDESSRKRPRPSLQDFSSSSSSMPAIVNTDEIQPVVEALKRAFGLELFGFDVLISDKQTMLVVDVNYFPSYKEVQNFPSLLANYLTDRAIQSRRRSALDNNSIQNAVSPQTTS